MVDIPDPTVLYRVRDGVYAGDLLIAAVADLDLFTWPATHEPVTAATSSTARRRATAACCSPASHSVSC